MKSANFEMLCPTPGSACTDDAAARLQLPKHGYPDAKASPMTGMIAAALVAVAIVSTPVAAQPYGRCGEQFAPPAAPKPGCHWSCVEQYVPGTFRGRLVWKEICPPQPPINRGGGKVEINKKNVPQVQKNSPPRD